MTTPYYTSNGITIFNADMRDVTLPENALTLTDPPFSEETHKGARTHAKEGTPDLHTGKRRLIGKGVKLLTTFDSITLEELRDCFDLIGVAARAWVISFMDWRHIHRFEAEPPAGLRFVRFGIWVAPNKAPQFTGDRPATGWEGIAHMHREGGRMRWNGGGHHAVYIHNISHQDHRISDNVTAKPLPLILELMRLFSQPGDLVLDPFMGTGTTLAAARLLKRHAVGIERDEAQCEALAKWLETKTALLGELNEAPQLTLLEDAA